MPLNEQLDKWKEKQLNILLLPGDIVLTRGTGLISRGIRVCTRSIGESRTKVNHVGMITSYAKLSTAEITEALREVVEHQLREYYNDGKTKVAIFRANNITAEERELLSEVARSFIGRKYGYLKIVAHFLDWSLFGIYFFRKLCKMPNYPMCAWHVLYCYAKLEKYFGVEVGEGSPDDIWDFVVTSDRYDTIYTLKRLP